MTHGIIDEKSGIVILLRVHSYMFILVLAVLTTSTFQAQACGGLRSGTPEPVIREISAAKVEVRDDELLYVKGENLPFTGATIGLYEDNSKWETPYKNGLKHGVQVVTREKVIEHITYKHGIQHGLRIMEDREDGTIILEQLYENGKKIRTIK